MLTKEISVSFHMTNINAYK